ncbi:MAG: leucyl aminopeptidase family protein [Acidimicrobiia bacterium]
MRDIRTEEEAPQGAVRVVGVVGGEPLQNIPVVGADLESLGFKGELAETVAVAGPEGPLILVGLGETVDAVGLRRAAGAAARRVPAGSVIATSLHHLEVDGALESTVVGLLSGSYSFDQYRSRPAVADADIVLVGRVDAAGVDRAILIAGAIWRTRDWVNRPPVDTSPEVLGGEMADDLEAAGFEVEVWDEAKIVAERLGGLAGVAAGSVRPPRMLVGRYRPAEATGHLGLVGKGIVFDSGGLSIKSATMMETMKSDMAGAAAVVTGAATIARLELAVEVSIFVPLTDNLPSGSATKPGDVLTARNGKTIEVLNTDAEGRLVLADGLALAAEEEPDLIVDMATLTGAARVALGDHIAALFASSDEVAALVEAAAEIAGERLWRMPLPADYRQVIDSTVADMKNTGGRSGSAINAALLLSEFVGETPWAHVDIAAPAWFLEDNPLGPKGGSGFGVQTVVALASELERAGTPTL